MFTESRGVIFLTLKLSFYKMSYINLYKKTVHLPRLAVYIVKK
jgi:hypothetical protein